MSTRMWILGHEVEVCSSQTNNCCRKPHTPQTLLWARVRVVLSVPQLLQREHTRYLWSKAWKNQPHVILRSPLEKFNTSHFTFQHCLWLTCHSNTSLTKDRSLLLPPFLTNEAKSCIQMQKPSKTVTGAIIAPILCREFCHPEAAFPPPQEHSSRIRSELQCKGSATFAIISQKTEIGSSFQHRSAFSKSQI